MSRRGRRPGPGLLEELLFGLGFVVITICGVICRAVVALLDCLKPK